MGDGAEVVIISAIDQVEKFGGLYKDLKSRGIDFVFLPKLHSKIYLFITNTEYRHRAAETPSLGIIGSSNLTKSGIPSKTGEGNYETNYTVSEKSVRLLEDIVIDLYMKAFDFHSAVRYIKRLR